MALSDYDKAHVGDILAGQGDWFSARLLRALNDLLPYADEMNEYKLRSTWPEECGVLTAHYNMPSKALSEAFPGLADAANGLAGLGGE